MEYGNRTFWLSDPDASWERRWISIPANVWHRPVINVERGWTVVSFHTVPPEELIEEGPDDSREAGTKEISPTEVTHCKGSTDSVTTADHYL
jgi:hypothetical protein